MLAKPVPSIGYHECAYVLRRDRDAPFIDCCFRLLVLVISQ
jgi:hypothetical protein